MLIAVLFFNWYGYRLLTGYLQQVAGTTLQTRLDNNDYDESALIPIKIPVSALSYYETTDQWERVDGEMILGNVAYRYVKRRIHNDSIELLCIRNNAEMQLNEAGNAFFRLVNDLTHFPHSKTTGAPDLHKVYTPENLDFRFSLPETAGMPLSGFRIPLLTAGHRRPSERPPAGRTFLV